MERIIKPRPISKLAVGSGKSVTSRVTSVEVRVANFVCVLVLPPWGGITASGSVAALPTLKVASITSARIDPRMKTRNFARLSRMNFKAHYRVAFEMPLPTVSGETPAFPISWKLTHSGQSCKS